MIVLNPRVAVATRRGVLPAAIVLGVFVGMTQAQDLSVEIAIDQRVSISGRSVSRKSVVEDACYRAGVEVLFYDADDRPFGGAYTSLPFPVFLERALAEESYMIETIWLPGTDTARVTSLRVLGDPAVARLRRARGGGSRKAVFQVPPALVQTAFGGDNAAEADRQAALTTLAERISGDAEQLRLFLATDSGQIAQAISRFVGVEQPLRELRGRYSDPRIAAKIDEIIAALSMQQGKSR